MSWRQKKLLEARTEKFRHAERRRQKFSRKLGYRNSRKRTQPETKCNQGNLFMPSERYMHKTWTKRIRQKGMKLIQAALDAELTGMDKMRLKDRKRTKQQVIASRLLTHAFNKKKENLRDQYTRLGFLVLARTQNFVRLKRLDISLDTVLSSLRETELKKISQGSSFHKFLSQVTASMLDYESKIFNLPNPRAMFLQALQMKFT